MDKAEFRGVVHNLPSRLGPEHASRDQQGGDDGRARSGRGGGNSSGSESGRGCSGGGRGRGGGAGGDGGNGRRAGHERRRQGNWSDPQEERSSLQGLQGMETTGLQHGRGAGSNAAGSHAGHACATPPLEAERQLWPQAPQVGAQMLYSKLVKLKNDADSMSACKLLKSDLGCRRMHKWLCLLRVQYDRARRIAVKRVEQARRPAKRHARDHPEAVEAVVAATELLEAEQKLADLEASAPCCNAHITAAAVSTSASGEPVLEIRSLQLRHTCVQLAATKAAMMPRAVNWQDFAACAAQFYIDMHCSAVTRTLRSMIAQYVRRQHGLQCHASCVSNAHVEYARKALKLYVNGPERCFGFLPRLGESVMDADPHAVFEVTVVTVRHRTLNFILAEDGESISCRRGPCRSRDVSLSKATREKQHRILAKVKKEVDLNRGSPSVLSHQYRALQRLQARQRWQIDHATRMHAMQRQQPRVLLAAGQSTNKTTGSGSGSDGTGPGAAPGGIAVPGGPASDIHATSHGQCTTIAVAVAKQVAVDPHAQCATARTSTAGSGGADGRQATPAVAVPALPSSGVSWAPLRAGQGAAQAADAMKPAGGQGQHHALNFRSAESPVSTAGDDRAAVRQATAVPAVPAAQVPGPFAAGEWYTAPSGPGAGTPVPTYPAAPAAAAMEPAGTKGQHDRCNVPSAENPIEVLHCEGVFYLVGKGMRALLSKCTQPHLLVDYCHCKCGGGLYVVVAQDGNNQILPIAVQWLPNFEVSASHAGKAELGAVPNMCTVGSHLTLLHGSAPLPAIVLCLLPQNKDGWEKFGKRIHTATGGLIEQLGIFSDRMGGMADVVKHAFRAAWVRWCAKHDKANLPRSRSQERGEALRKVYDVAVFDCDEAAHQAAMAVLPRAVAKKMLRKPPEEWANCKSPHGALGTTTQSAAESFNSLILMARHQDTVFGLFQVLIARIDELYIKASLSILHQAKNCEWQCVWSH